MQATLCSLDSWIACILHLRVVFRSCPRGKGSVSGVLMFNHYLTVSISTKLPLSYAHYASLRFAIFEDKFSHVFKTVLSSGYILILLSIENILASLIETCQGWSRMRNVK